MHGATAARAAGERRVQEARALELAGRVAPGTDLTEFGDPIDALEHVLAISHHMAIRLAGIVGRMGDDELAWRGRTGEQLRGEVVAAQRALADRGGSRERRSGWGWLSGGRGSRSARSP